MLGPVNRRRVRSAGDHPSMRVAFNNQKILATSLQNTVFARAGRPKSHRLEAYATLPADRKPTGWKPMPRLLADRKPTGWKPMPRCWPTEFLQTGSLCHVSGRTPTRRQRDAATDVGHQRSVASATRTPSPFEVTDSCRAPAAPEEFPNPNRPAETMSRSPGIRSSTAASWPLRYRYPCFSHTVGKRRRPTGNRASSV